MNRPPNSPRLGRKPRKTGPEAIAKAERTATIMSERWSANRENDDLSAASEFAFKKYELKLLAALARCYRGKIGFEKLPMIPLRMAELIIRAGGLGEWMNRDEKRLKRFWDMVREQSKEGPKLKSVRHRPRS